MTCVDSVIALTAAKFVVLTPEKLMEAQSHEV